MKKLSKFISLILAVFLFIGLVACDKVELHLLHEGDIKIKVDEEFKIEYELKGEGVIEWTSSNPDIATVSSEGVVKGLKVGETTITATIKDKKSSASIKVIVEEKEVIKPTMIVITGVPDEVKVGQVVQLAAQIAPANASKDVEWKTSDQTIATVDQTGKVTFLKDGKVTISVTSKVANNVKAEVEIDVLKADPTEIIITTVTGLTKVNLYDTLQLLITVNPEGANSEVLWSVSDSSIASIDGNGLLKTKNTGKVTVTATSRANKEIKGTIEIEVVIPAPSMINVTVPYTTIQVDEEMKVSYTVLPDIADPAVKFESSNTNIATVSDNGIIKGVAAGDVEIIVKSKVDESVYTKVKIKVVAKIEDLGHKNFIIDESLKNKERFEKVTINDVLYYVGVNAFSDFTTLSLSEGSEIYVKPGTYTGNLTIDKNNVTIYSDNKDKDPNSTKFDFNKQAIVKGKILIADGVSGLVINGLSFTENARVENQGAVKDFTFKNNYAFNTAKPTNNWSALRDYNQVGLLTLWKQQKYIENALIENNRFYNVPDTNIMIGNTKGVTIRNNTFINFERDAVRVDGGYNYGKTLFEGNNFINDVMQGYNGIYFRAIGADKDSYGTENLNVIEVKNNYFKNIGQNELLTGAISTSTYQEYGAEINIHHNTFETCMTYITLRNNATAENHATYKWIGKINYNVFLGIPEKFYHNNKNASDNDTTNPPMVNMDYNFFGDLDGNPVDLNDNDIKAKFVNVASLKYTYVSREAMDAIFVSKDWAGKQENEEVMYSGMKFIYGVNAFATITDAYNAASENSRIIVLPGTYDESIEIKKAIKLETLHAKVSPTVDDSLFKLDANDAVIITNVWYVQTSNISIKGFTFTGNARIRQYGKEGDPNTKNFVFENNYVVNTTAATIAWKQDAYASYGTTEKNNTTIPGFISLAPNSIWILDTKIVNNKFENVSDTNVLLLSVAGVTISGNIFKGSDRDAIRFDYTSTYGYIDIFNNIFEDIKYNGIYIRSYGFQYGTPTIFTIEKNTFKNIGEASLTETPSHARIGAITASRFSEKNSASFTIRFNTFVDNYNYITLRINVTKSTWEASGLTWDATIKYNAFIDSNGVDYYVRNLVASNDTTETNLNNILIDNNFYGIDENTKATIENKQFDHHLVDQSNKTVYNSYQELLQAIADYEDFIKPIVVDSNLVEVENGTKVTYDGVELEVGKHAFANFKDAINKSVSGKTIYVKPGEYTFDTVTITVNNLTIYGPNANIDPNTKTRKDEALIYGIIIVGEGVKNLTINGLSFTYHQSKSYIAGHENGMIEGFTFAYNIIDTASDAVPGGSEGQVKFKQASQEKGIKDFTFAYNQFLNAKSDRAIRLAYIENLTVIGNKFTNTYDAIRCNDNNGSVSGKLIVKDNTFDGILQYAIFTAATTLSEIEISGNTFNNCATGAISIRQLTIPETGTTIKITNNTIRSTSGTDIEIVHSAEESTNLTILVENNTFYSKASKIYTNRNATGSGSTVVSKTQFKKNNKVYDENNTLVDLSTLMSTKIENATLVD